ncbi:MAG: DsrE/DsrF/DrsH-like family protein [Chloroflexota bacterium]
MTQKPKDKLAIVVFSGDLDKALVAFMLAITGASMAMEVTMFFTFWGLNIIRKDRDGTKKKGLTRKILNFFNPGGSKRLRLSAHHVLGLGTWMMKRQMNNIDMPAVDELITMAHDSRVKFIACTTGMELLGLTKDSFRSEVDEFAGSATFLSEATKAKTSLFI